jgi:hypothetical protein
MGTTWGEKFAQIPPLLSVFIFVVYILPCCTVLHASVRAPRVAGEHHVAAGERLVELGDRPGKLGAARAVERLPGRRSLDEGLLALSLNILVCMENPCRDAALQ